MIAPQTITYEKLRDDPAIQTEIILEVLSPFVSKKVKRIVSWCNRQYRLDLDQHEKMSLHAIFRMRVNELQAREWIQKTENGYILSQWIFR